MEWLQKFEVNVSLIFIPQIIDFKDDTEKHGLITDREQKYFLIKRADEHHINLEL